MIDMPCPFKALIPHSGQDSAWFCERDDDIRHLIANIRAYPQVVFYGPSGAGKSSLLTAGVQPKINSDQNYQWLWEYAFYWHNWTNDWKQDLLNSLTEKLFEIFKETSMAEEITAIQNSSFLSTESLQESLQKLLNVFEQKKLHIYLLLDQFEDIFVGRTVSQVSEIFGKELAGVISNRALSVNILLSIREDELARLSVLENDIPELFEHRVNLEPLTHAQAKAAVNGSIEIFQKEVNTPVERQVRCNPELLDSVISLWRTASSTDPADYKDSEIANYLECLDKSNESKHGDAINTLMLQLCLYVLWTERDTDDRGSKEAKALFEPLTHDDIEPIETSSFIQEVKIVTYDHVTKLIDKHIENNPYYRRAAIDLLDKFSTSAGRRLAQSDSELLESVEDGASFSKQFGKLYGLWSRVRYKKSPPDREICEKLCNGLTDDQIIRKVPGNGIIFRYEVKQGDLVPALVEWRRRATNTEIAKSDLIKNSFSGLIGTFIIALALTAVFVWYQNTIQSNKISALQVASFVSRQYYDLDKALRPLMAIYASSREAIVGESYENLLNIPWLEKQIKDPVDNLIPTVRRTEAPNEQSTYVLLCTNSTCESPDKSAWKLDFNNYAWSRSNRIFDITKTCGKAGEEDIARANYQDKLSAYYDCDATLNNNGKIMLRSKEGDMLVGWGRPPVRQENLEKMWFDTDGNWLMIQVRSGSTFDLGIASTNQGISPTFKWKNKLRQVLPSNDGKHLLAVDQSGRVSGILASDFGGNGEWKPLEDEDTIKIKLLCTPDILQLPSVPIDSALPDLLSLVLREFSVRRIGNILDCYGKTDEIRVDDKGAITWIWGAHEDSSIAIDDNASGVAFSTDGQRVLVFLNNQKEAIKPQLKYYKREAKSNGTHIPLPDAMASVSRILPPRNSDDMIVAVIGKGKSDSNGFAEPMLALVDDQGRQQNCKLDSPDKAIRILDYVAAFSADGTSLVVVASQIEPTQKKPDKSGEKSLQANFAAWQINVQSREKACAGISLRALSGIGFSMDTIIAAVADTSADNGANAQPLAITTQGQLYNYRIPKGFDMGWWGQFMPTRVTDANKLIVTQKGQSVLVASQSSMRFVELFPQSKPEKLIQDHCEKARNEMNNDVQSLDLYNQTITDIFKRLGQPGEDKNFRDYISKKCHLIFEAKRS